MWSKSSAYSIAECIDNLYLVNVSFLLNRIKLPVCHKIFMHKLRSYPVGEQHLHHQRMRMIQTELHRPRRADGYMLTFTSRRIFDIVEGTAAFFTNMYRFWDNAALPSPSFRDLSSRQNPSIHPLFGEVKLRDRN